MASPWNKTQFKDGRRLNFYVLCEYKKRVISETTELISRHVLNELSQMIVSYIRIGSQPSFDDLVVYGSLDERAIHGHAIKQIASWNEMRMTSHIYSGLFIDDINRLVDTDHKVIVRYGELDIIHDAAISITVKAAMYVSSIHTDIHPISLSLYNFNTNRETPIVGIGRILFDPTAIMILVRGWCMDHREWYGALYKYNLYEMRIRATYMNGSQKILDAFDTVGVFYVAQ